MCRACRWVEPRLRTTRKPPHRGRDLCRQFLTFIRSATLASRSRRLVDVIVRHKCWRLRKEVDDVAGLQVGR
jgi:hypothetical protein